MSGKQLTYEEKLAKIEERRRKTPFGFNSSNIPDSGSPLKLYGVLPTKYRGGKKSKKAKPKKKSRTRKAKPTQTKMPQKRIKSLIKKEKKQQNDIYLNSEPSLLKIKERNLKNATFKKNTKWEKYPSYTSLMTQVQ